MESKNKFCQSCGMPMKQDPQNGGPNADGTKNDKFCSYCYQNGTFTFTGTMEEMQKFCIGKMTEKGMSKWMAWIFTRGMSRLERWKK